MKAKVYSTPVCPYCTLAKNYLKGKGVEVQEIDVSRDHQAAREMIEKTGQMGVPVIEINGHLIVGFNRQAIDEALSQGNAGKRAEKKQI